MPRPTLVGMLDNGEPPHSRLHLSRNLPQGIVASYTHQGGRIGALVELHCETDFVARTDEFRTLGRELAMQVAAMNPSTIGSMDSPGQDSNALLDQEYIRDSSKTIRDLIDETIAKVREEIWVARFIRFEVGGNR